MAVGIFFGSMLSLAATLVGFEIVAPWGKELRLIISKDNVDGRTSWDLYLAARGIIFRHYEYFSVPVAMPIGANRQKWELDLALDNSTYETHGLWSVARRVPVFPKNQPPVDSVTYRDLYLGTCAEDEFQREVIIFPGLVGLVVVGHSLYPAIKRSMKVRVEGKSFV